MTPANQNKLTPLYQSNVISNSTLVYKANNRLESLNLWQNKFFAAILFGLRPLFEMKMTGKNELPGTLQFDKEDATFVLNIDLAKIVTKQNYNTVFEAIERLQTGFKIVLPSLLGEYREEISMIILSIDRPKIRNSNYKDSLVQIKIAKRAALAMAEIKLDRGRPIEFTKWYYEVAINATSKYTQKFYWLLAARKNEGRLIIKLADLRAALGIGQDELKNFAFFKREVLKRVEKDLKKHGDCYISLDEDGIEYKKEGAKIISLHLKIFKRKIVEEVNNLYICSIISTLKKHFKLNDDNIEEIVRVLKVNDRQKDCDAVLMKLAQINTKFHSGRLKIQSSLAGYIIQSIKNLFETKK